MGLDELRAYVEKYVGRNKADPLFKVSSSDMGHLGIRDLVGVLEGVVCLRYSLNEPLPPGELDSANITFIVASAKTTRL